MYPSLIENRSVLTKSLRNLLGVVTWKSMSASATVGVVMWFECSGGLTQVANVFFLSLHFSFEIPLCKLTLKKWERTWNRPVRGLTHVLVSHPGEIWDVNLLLMVFPGNEVLYPSLCLWFCMLLRPEYWRGWAACLGETDLERFILKYIYPD